MCVTRSVAKTPPRRLILCILASKVEEDSLLSEEGAEFYVSCRQEKNERVMTLCIGPGTSSIFGAPRQKSFIIHSR